MKLNTEHNNQVGRLVRTSRMLSGLAGSRPQARQSQAIYYRMLTEYYDRIKTARSEGRILAGHTIFFPSEILYAMDIVPLHTESAVWSLSLFLGEQSQYLSAASEIGLASEICSPHRGLAGAFASGALPKPDLMLWSNLICDNSAKSGELLMALNECPGYFLDHPFDDSPAESRYFEEELEDMIGFLEGITGRKMDWDRLSEIVARMDQQMEFLREIGELRKAVPSPFPTAGYLELLSVDYLFPGQPEAVEYLETLRNELREIVDQGKGAVEPESFRLMTLFLPPMHLMASLDGMYASHGALSVVEPFFTRWEEGRLDPRRPLRSVAAKADLIPERRTMYGPLQQSTLQGIADCAEEYRIDGAIYWAFCGCRHTCATIKVFKDVLAEVDVPMLTLDCDLLDPTFTTEAETRFKLDQFFEMLEDR